MRVVRPADVLVTDEEVTVHMDVPGVTPAWLQTARSGQRRLPRHLGADPARLRPAHERPPGWDGGLYAFIRRVLSTEHAKALYRKRQETIESVFGQMKFNRRLDRFLCRGRSAVRSEWRLLGAGHNLLKLHRHRILAAAV